MSLQSIQFCCKECVDSKLKLLVKRLKNATNTKGTWFAEDSLEEKKQDR